jgi:uncharacterized protein (DUF2236 family)
MSSNNAAQEWLSKRFRRLLSGAPDGTPPWLDVIARGETGGLFLPTDAPWVVHRDFGTLVGGIRALLMQALHPGSLAGVSDHSRYEKDPLGRLAGTIRWLTVTTFGSHEAVATEAGRVNRLHDRVTGSYETGAGAMIPYRAADTDLLLWVHIAFMESFLVAHEMYATTPLPLGTAATPADNYVNQWAASVAPLGLETVPRTRAEVDHMITDLWRRGILVASDSTRSVVGFIRRPPLPLPVRPVYRLLFDAAVVSIRPEFQAMLGLKPKPRWLIVPLTRFVLRAIRIGIGPESAIEDSALRRLRRLGLI